jgi:RNA polymerase primary sigma factor
MSTHEIGSHHEPTASSEKTKPTLVLRFLPGYKISVNDREFNLAGQVERRAILKVEILKMLLARRLPDGGSEPITRDEIRAHLERDQIEFTRADIVGIADLRPNIKIKGKSVVDRIWSKTEPILHLNPAFSYLIEGEQIPDRAGTSKADSKKAEHSIPASQTTTPNPPAEPLFTHPTLQSPSVVREWTSPPLPIVKSFDTLPQKPVKDLPDLSTSQPPSTEQVDDIFVRPGAWDEIVNTDEDTHSERIDTGNWYRRLIGRYKVLTSDKEIDLFQRLENGDTDAKEELILHNLRIIPYVLRSYFGIKNIGADLNREGSINGLDLVQEGYFGLLRAVELHDFRKGSFISYTKRWVRQSMIRGLTYQSRNIRFPVNIQEARRHYAKSYELLTQEIGREATAKEVALKLEKTPEEIKRIFLLDGLNTPIADVFGDESLESVQTQADPEEFEHDPDNIPTNDMKPEIEELLIDRTEEIEHETTISDIAVIPIITEALTYVNERERWILRRRFGLDNGTTSTLEEVGKELGVTRERIRQLEKKALEKLRNSDQLRILYDNL